MSSENVNGIREQFVRSMTSLRVNSFALLAATVLVISGLFYTLVARAAIADGRKEVGDTKTTDVTNSSKAQDRIKEQPLSTDVSFTAISNAQSSTDSNIGVSINGTPISIPENGSVDMTVPSSSGNGDVKVSIDSSSSTDNSESGSSASISIQSTTNTWEEH